MARSGNYLPAAFAVALLVAVAPASLAESAGELIDFELTDQFDRTYSNSTFAGRGLVIVGSDRHGSEYNPKWSKALQDALEARGLKDGFAFVGHADLRAVPFFLKGSIKGKFPQDEESWVLLDWKGVFPKSYGFVKKHSNTLIFGTDGRLIYQLEGLEVEQGKIDAAVAAVIAAQ